MQKGKRLFVAMTVFAFVVLPLVVTAAYAADSSQPGAMKPGTEKMEKAPAAHMGSGGMAAQAMTVTGTILANKNKAGKIISYSLTEEGGQSFLLSKHGKGKQLRKMVGQKIAATGTLREAKGHKWITVKAFKEIK